MAKITFDLDDLKSLLDGLRKHYVDDIGINEYGTLHVYKKRSPSVMASLESKLKGEMHCDDL